jgi:hypothetical protein
LFIERKIATRLYQNEEIAIQAKLGKIGTVMIICIDRENKAGKCISFDPSYVLVGLCPNCARQGQIFPNSSKRDQKLVEKVV